MKKIFYMSIPRLMASCEARRGREVSASVLMRDAICRGGVPSGAASIAMGGNEGLTPHHYI